MEGEDGSTGDGNDTEQFIATGRTGRRNAVPDIHDEAVATTSTADLPDVLQKLTCGEGTSKDDSGGGGGGKDDKPQASGS
ncbi:UNVERIFIED_CONTAM: hypothetical protein RMT77_003150 [Armadillidium vulgare]|nr:hypothetical protein Avbf_00034 [Armadillidium vulgare]